MSIIGTSRVHSPIANALRLQTFPDSFVFDGGKEAVRRQIGMAVPPMAAKQIFLALFKTFLGRSYRSVPANLTSLLNRQQLELGA